VGRVVGFLADIVAVARLLVEARDVWRGWRSDGASAEPGGGAAGNRPAEPAPSGPASGLGPPGPTAGPREVPGAGPVSDPPGGG
jgi:hypothetical protein